MHFMSSISLVNLAGSLFFILLAVALILIGVLLWRKDDDHKKTPAPKLEMEAKPFKGFEYGGIAKALPWGGDLEGGINHKNRLYTQTDPDNARTYQPMTWTSDPYAVQDYIGGHSIVGMVFDASGDVRYASYQPAFKNAYQLLHRHIAFDGVVNGGGSEWVPLSPDTKILPGYHRFRLVLNASTAHMVVYGLKIAVVDSHG